MLDEYSCVSEEEWAAQTGEVTGYEQCVRWQEHILWFAVEAVATVVRPTPIEPPCPCLRRFRTSVMDTLHVLWPHHPYRAPMLSILLMLENCLTVGRASYQMYKKTVSFYNCRNGCVSRRAADISYTRLEYHLFPRQ